jgi:hypothetical protein
MRTVGSRSLVLGSALLLALASPGRLAAQVPLVPGGAWELFEWFLGVGPVEGDGFSLNVAQDVRVRVTDAGFSGDAFQIFVNGSPFTVTPPVVPGINTGALTGAAAWAESALSKTEFVLGPGSYLIELAVSQDAGFGFGEGFIRADLVQVGVIPEPTSVVLLASGVVGIAGLRLRARRRTG